MGNTEKNHWFWTDEWQKMEEEATQDYENGRFKTFNTIDELILFLHKLNAGVA